MKRFEKFRVGQKVKVIRKVAVWKLPNGGGCSWNEVMNVTIGKVYEVISIEKSIGYELLTENDTYYKYNYWYPAESLAGTEGEQLLFDFMTP